ncbi:hypothetical protein CLV28_0854 [Sediminihabitans luteus]|uniref:Uncharacterized protein n=1 Tax=Sediminihabitans luteus TaxID=1138585 RepID=A0A2M9D0E8_9CELL|nr:hypothetical protein [Sediminihabitans luteus]PJJ77629.1 hypothetical protein CLV28_0854 [Sediminihabitans luteus]GII98529.1 hypothetical protein Slu03_09070 [Sediminihabitans luteus]
MSHVLPSATPDLPQFTYAVRLPDGRTESVVGPAGLASCAIATGPADPARASLALRRYAATHEGVALRLEQAASRREFVVTPAQAGHGSTLQLVGSGVGCSTCPEGPFDVMYPPSDLETAVGTDDDAADHLGDELCERALAQAVVERAAAHEHRERAARLLADPSVRGRWEVDSWLREGIFTRRQVVLTGERGLLHGRTAVLLPVAQTPCGQAVHAASTSS